MVTVQYPPRRTSVGHRAGSTRTPTRVLSSHCTTTSPARRGAHSGEDRSRARGTAVGPRPEVRRRRVRDQMKQGGVSSWIGRGRGRRYSTSIDNHGTERDESQTRSLVHRWHGCPCRHCRHLAILAILAVVALILKPSSCSVTACPTAPFPPHLVSSVAHRNHPSIHRSPNLAPPSNLTPPRRSKPSPTLPPRRQTT